MTTAGLSADMLHNQETQAIQRAIASLEAKVVMVNRKRSWRPSEKAMFVAEMKRDIEAMQRVLQHHVKCVWR